MLSITAPLALLRRYCEKDDFRGWDPYDGLNSKVFKAIPFVGRSAIMRLVWIQLFKRNPINLRRLMLVPKQHNAKGIGLFLHGYINIVKAIDARPELERELMPRTQALEKVHYLANLLIDMRSPGFSGAAWGYNFPWQCRREFLFPAGEPTVVATYFCATALFDAYELTGCERYRDIALTSADFVLNDLHYTVHKGGAIISYSKLPGNDTIYNASLLGAALLAYCYKYTGNEQYAKVAKDSVTACCADQRADGSWSYGVKAVTSWVDSFHTGYNLDGLEVYMRLTGDTSVAEAIEKGFEYYVNNFFMENGSPKYYNNKQYPIDIHCPGELFVVLYHLGKYRQYKPLADKVLRWTLSHMQSAKGYFYYQLKPGISSKIPYMRWSNAFMFASLTYALLGELDGYPDFVC